MTVNLVKWPFAAVIILVVSGSGGDSPSYFGPRFSKDPPARLEFASSKGTRIDCAATGNPIPSVTWVQIDGTPVTDIAEFRKVDIVASGGAATLVLAPFKAESFRPDVHSAVYRCVASNVAGTIHSWNVNVNGVVLQNHEILVYDSYAIEGNSAVFKCHVPSVLKDYMTVTAWIKNDNLLIQPATAEVMNGKFAVMPSGELHIHDVVLGENGSRFKCKAHHRLTGETLISSTDGQLFVTESRGVIVPKIFESQSSISVRRGQIVVIPCVAQGSPLPVLKWFKRESVNGERIPINFGDRLVKTDSAVIIRDGTTVDSGTYTCEASSEMGRDVRDIKVAVIDPVSVRLEPYVFETKIDDKVEFQCNASGKVASVSWLHNGSPMKMSSGNNLVIESVQIPDRGMYQCFVKGETGDIVQATSELQLSEISPQFVETFKEVILQPGSSLRLKCVSTGIPLPKITWQIDGMALNASSRLRIISSEAREANVVGILEIDKVVVQDGGVYSCVSLSVYGESIHSSRVNIFGPLGVRLVPPVLAVSGSTLLLNCPVYGYPISVVTWKKDNVQLGLTRTLKVSNNGTLIVKDVDRQNEAGLYKCLVHDEVGNKVAAEINVTVMVVPKIVPFEFQGELLREGMRARLQCVVSDGDLPLIVSWLKDGKPLSAKLPVSVRVLDEFSSILTINHITPVHNGKYTCVASNRAATVTHTAELSVNVPPKVIPFTFLDDQFYKGMRAHVTCAISQGDLPVNFMWLKDGTALVTSQFGASIRKYDELTESLSIDNVNSEHSGDYSCIVSNRAGQAKWTAELLVRVPPKVVPFSFQDEHLTEGQLARVSCIISRGDLPLKILWEKDGIPINGNQLDGKGLDIKSFDDYSSILSVTDVTREHNGLYTCIASNGAGSARHSTQLTVNVPPRWSVQPQDVSVLKGCTAVMHCSVRGFPKPVISWMRVTGISSGEEFSPVINGPRIRISENGSLIIRDVNDDDEGHYSCEASNGIGKQISGYGQIKIFAPPIFKEGLSDQNVPLGSKIQLRCLVQGNPPIQTTWFRNKKIIQASQSRLKIEITNVSLDSLSALTIYKAAGEDNANFSCVAANSFGTSTSSAELKVIEPPNAPQEFKADTIDSRIIEVSWESSFNGNDKILKYIIEHKLEADAWEDAKTMQTVNGEPTSGIISQLQPATDYMFRIFAENSQGRSPSSAILRLTTAEDAPSGPPQNLHIEPVNMETFKVFWSAPKDELWNGKIQGYYIGYKETEGNDQYVFKTLMTREPKADDLYVQIGGLKQFTKYSVVVLAYNSKGKGPQTESVVVMTSEGAPSLPPIDVRCTTLTSQAIHVTYAAPPADSVNGILRDYKVIHKPVTDGIDDSQEIVAATNATSLTLSHLEKFMNYSIEVQASTRAGDSPRSAPVHCKTLDDVPSSPMDIKALVTSEISVTVSWKNPENQNGVLQSFTVYWKEGNNEKAAASSKVTSHLNHYVIEQLKPGLQYEFWVTASTLVGEGQPSRTVSQMPSGPKVPARIISFDDKMVSPWRIEMQLPCLAVGNPRPERKWQFRGNVVEASDQVGISNDGTLILKNVLDDDAGDYVCIVRNDVNEDKITHTVIVLSPPSVVRPEIVSIASNAIDLKWATPVSKLAKLKGYTLKVKRNDEEWKEIALDAEAREYKINSLDCGAQYEVVMVAHNRIGSSSPSELLVLFTNGSVPVSPSKSDMIEETSSSVSLYLNTWKNNGCPIKYYVVEYAPKSSDEWTMVSSSVKPEQRRLVIPNLKSATRYNLRMTAHNSAGSTVAKYEFATLTTSGATIGPELQSDEPYNRVDSLMTQLNFYLVVPVICTAIILVAIFGVAYMCIKLKKTDRRSMEVSQRLAAVYELKRGDSSESFDYMQRGTMCRPSSTVKQAPSDITPYATLQLIHHGNHMNTMGRQGVAPPLPPPRFDGFSCEGNHMVDPNFFQPATNDSFMPGTQGQLVETTFVFPTSQMGESPVSAVNTFPPGYQNDNQK